MSPEKRLVLFFVLSVAIMWGMQLTMSRLGLLPKPVPKAAQQEAKGPAPEKPAAPQQAAKVEKEAPKPAPQPDENENEKEKVALAKTSELILGSATDHAPGGYRLEVQLDQRGAGVTLIRSSRLEAELQEGQPRKRPLILLRPDQEVLGPPPAFTLNVFRPRPDAGADADQAGLPEAVPLMLESRYWQLVRDEQGRAVRPLSGVHPQTHAATTGQEIVFQTTIGDPNPITVTRHYRLWTGQDSFEMELGFASPAGDQKFFYELMGPHEIPVEGEWYTRTFRDVFFGGASGTGNKVVTLTAADVAKHQDNPERFTTWPLTFAGVENQYFAVFAQPVPRPETLDQSWIKEAVPMVLYADPNARQKADVTVKLTSKPIAVGPNLKSRHLYHIFAGPKTYQALEPLAATELSVYRKGSILWGFDFGASFMAQHLITPMLQGIHAFTASVAHVFGGKNGSFGIAIILLTMSVRLILFPLGRKQAKAAKKMQDMQPLLTELKEKYKDDKEGMAREQFALFRKHGVNPMGGCLLVFIQLPVLMGLWQALNNSVALRHSGFLWIKDLAAPDMLFKFPFPIPLVGGWLGPYFNLLPLVVVALMLVQTKLFSPPATTPEAESQQKMMKFMMFFMMFMFYTVPAGLSIYLITSSIWQIGERLLLPKTTLIMPTPPPAPAVAEVEERGSRPAPGGGGKGRPSGGDGAGPAPGGWWSDLRDRAQQILDDAEKQRTVRNPGERRDRDRPRPRPGRKR